MGWLLVGLYGWLALIGWLNLWLMRRPGRASDGPSICVLIPARNEERNLARLLPALMEPNPGLQVIVFDDESEDRTAEVARSHGASVVVPAESLPAGWTGKNRACHELALESSRTDAEWFLFLDADVMPSPDFLPAIRWLSMTTRASVGLITGFPKVLPGRGIEPLFLAWVGWVLLVSNPYGLVARTGLGHNRFKNGQVHCWRREVYLSLMPNEKVRSHIMEDVTIGRLLAREGIPVEVANLSSVLSVRMYETWRETLDGMSKNSFEITNSEAGAVLMAAVLLFLGWGWLLVGHLWLPALALFLLGGCSVMLVVRAPLWGVVFMPLIPTIGAFTVLRSMVWHRRGQVKWKGRVYGGRVKGSKGQRVIGGKGS